MESGTQMSNGKVPLEMVIYDNIYKRIMIDILMDRTFDETRKKSIVQYDLKQKYERQVV